MPEREWRSIDNDPPGWQDDGLIEVRRGDEISQGKLIASDVSFYGEDEEEYPIFELILKDGTKASIWDYDYYRAASPQ